MMLSKQRKSIFPQAGDDWTAIAKRELPDTPVEEAIGHLESWNLHVFMRSMGAPGAPKGDNPVLPSDVIFVEPPLAL